MGNRPYYEFNKHTKIGIDIDDTIYDLLGKWTTVLNKKYGYNVKVDDIVDWDMSRFYPTLTQEELFSPMNDDPDGFFENINLKDGAVEYIQKLYDEGFDIYFVTSSHYKNMRIKFEKIVERYFSFIPWTKVIVTSNKNMVSVDVMIDDNVDNLKGKNTYGILFEAPHNKNLNIKDIYKIKGSDYICKADSWISVYNSICLWRELEIANSLLGGHRKGYGYEKVANIIPD